MATLAAVTVAHPFGIMMVGYQICLPVLLPVVFIVELELGTDDKKSVRDVNFCIIWVDLRGSTIWLPTLRKDDLRVQA